MDASVATDDRMVLLGFVHDRCEPCRELRPQLEELAVRAQEVCRVQVVDAALDPETARRHQVREFPTLLFLWHGRELQRIRGGALPASTLALLEGGRA
jgi:thioredoxin-like negative regulator of GroEL